MYLTFECSGGMLHYAANLAASAGKEHEGALAFFTSGADNSRPAADMDVIELKKSPSWARHVFLEKYNIFYYRKKARQLMSGGLPSLVHFTSYSEGLLAFIKYLSRSGVKTVFTVHDPMPHEENMTTWGRIFNTYKLKYQLPQVLKSVDAIHVHSEMHRDALVILYGGLVERKIYVVQHGGGIPDSVKAGNKAPVEIKDRLSGNYTILFFGRIHPYKGLQCLEDAARIVRGKGLKMNLVVAGDGNLNGLFNVDSEENIVINRFLEDCELASLFKSAHAVVLPYISATQSGVIPMAYAFGKPVICANVGALKELVRDRETGLLVPPRDAAALADAIISLSDENIQKKMGAAARRYIEEEISWSSIASRHLEEYRSIM